MASIKLKGDTSGEVTISAPAVAGTTTLELPATSSTLATQNALGVRNLIINGDMRIAQRGTSASIASSGFGYYVIDRFGAQAEDVDGSYDLEQSTDAPDDFNYSMLVTVTGADSLADSSDNHCVAQRIEGYNISHLNWGTANAKTVTLSFWVKSSLTGTFGGTLTNAQNATRAYGFTYTINTTNTWEKKTVTVLGDTSGTWNTNNSIGIILAWSLGANAARATTAGEWSTISSRQATGVVGEDTIIGTLGATWQITGVQLEVGDTATPFEHRPYDMELARCQRYYEKSYNTETAVPTATDTGSYMFLSNRNPGLPHTVLVYKTTKRTTPTVNLYNSQTNAIGEMKNLDTAGNQAAAASRIGANFATLYSTVNTNLGQFLQFHYTVDAEL